MLEFILLVSLFDISPKSLPTHTMLFDKTPKHMVGHNNSFLDKWVEVPHHYYRSNGKSTSLQRIHKPLSFVILDSFWLRYRAIYITHDK
jgi:hypothetical protein